MNDCCPQCGSAEKDKPRFYMRSSPSDKWRDRELEECAHDWHDVAPAPSAGEQGAECPNMYKSALENLLWAAKELSANKLVRNLDEIFLFAESTLAMPTPSVEGERKEFEKWTRTFGWKSCTCRENGKYINRQLQVMWYAWQARAALAQREKG